MDRILATLMFFTRLPFWRIKQVDAEHFKHVVPFWPLAGWLTGGIMVCVLWLAGQFMPISMAWMVAIVTRLLLTGLRALMFSEMISCSSSVSTSPLL